MTRTQCRDQSKSRVSDVSEGNWKHKKISCRINEPSILGLGFPPMVCKKEEISWTFVKIGCLYVTFVGSPRPKDTFGQCRIAAGNIARTLQQYFCTSQDGQNRNERAAFCSFIVSPMTGL